MFRLKDKYWMIADIWEGQAVYASDDLTNWIRQAGEIMSGAGKRREDGNRAHHADVLVVNDHAYMFYFVHPGQAEHQCEGMMGEMMKRRSSVQTAELIVENGMLRAVRDEPFDFFLPDGDA